MKRIKCLLKNGLLLNPFWTGLRDMFFMAHSYREKSNRFVKTRKRFEQVLVCKVCGDKSIGWRL